MINEPSEIAMLLQDTTLAGRQVSSVTADRSGNNAFLVSLTANDDHLNVWTELRNLVATTGRYPQIVLDMFLEFLPMIDDAETMLAMADSSGQRFSDLRVTEGPYEFPVEEWWELVATEQRFGSRPATGDLGPLDGMDPIKLSRILFDWERATFGDEGVLGRRVADLNPWFTHGEFSLVLWPTADPDAVVSYIGFWPTDDDSRMLASLINDLRHWRLTYGAELVANFQTMLQFVVANPPTDLDAAYQVATEHYQVAEAGFQLSGDVVHHYAADMVAATHWALHDRP